MSSYNKNNGTYYYNDDENKRRNDAFNYEYDMTLKAYNRAKSAAKILRGFSGFFIFSSFFGGWFFGGFLSSIFIFGGASMLLEQRAKNLENKLYRLRMRKNPSDVPKMEVKNDKVSSLQREAKRYIQLIRAANDAIPGEEISSDIYSIEQLTQEIFNYAIKNPDKTSELNSFFSYYLPTTLKLLNTYANLEEQPIQTEQISATKREIHEMLKKIKAAFAKLYDQIFNVTALDISSEITAMEGMMSTQGLLNPIELDLKEAVKKAQAEEDAAAKLAAETEKIKAELESNTLELKLPEMEKEK